MGVSRGEEMAFTAASPRHADPGCSPEDELLWIWREIRCRDRWEAEEYSVFFSSGWMHTKMVALGQSACHFLYHHPSVGSAPLVLRHTVTLACGVAQTHSVLKYCSPFYSTLGFKLVLQDQFWLPLGWSCRHWEWTENVCQSHECVNARSIMTRF